MTVRNLDPSDEAPVRRPPGRPRNPENVGKPSKSKGPSKIGKWTVLLRKQDGTIAQLTRDEFASRKFAMVWVKDNVDQTDDGEVVIVADVSAQFRFVAVRRV